MKQHQTLVERVPFVDKGTSKRESFRAIASENDVLGLVDVNVVVALLTRDLVVCEIVCSIKLPEIRKERVVYVPDDSAWLYSMRFGTRME